MKYMQDNCKTKVKTLILQGEYYSGEQGENK